MNQKDYDSIQRKRNFIVGVFVLVALIALAWLIFRFGQMPVIVSRLGSYEVIGQFASAPGVQQNTPVRFCGYQIGRVTSIAAPEKLKDPISGLEYYQVRVFMRLDNRFNKIPSHAQLKLMRRGFGSSYIEVHVDPRKELVPLDPDRPESVFLMEGMTIQGVESEASEFLAESTQKKLEDLVEGITILVTNVNDIIGDRQNREDLRQLLENLKSVTTQAAETLKEVEAFSKAGTETAEQATESLVKVTGSMRELELILHGVNEGEGTVGRLMNDATLYESFVENSRELESLLVELRLFVAQAKESGLPIRLR
ncbi:MAG TPA: MlaD family protein [Sedimentisphaerales bacterium]|nr:MlaD family protein [Sedimentisphaerales bacterium]